jgi:Rrf2 family nitric oxide-sensitive transcriptional repressor
MLSQTIEYALRAMIHLASIPPDSALNSDTIADRTKVPKGYLSKILRDLVVAELVTSQRGPHGGFTLARDASKVSILDVINAVDPIKRIRKCPLGNPAHVHLCPLHKRLDDALGMIEREFARTTLREVLETSSTVTADCQTLVMPRIFRNA